MLTLTQTTIPVFYQRSSNGTATLAVSGESDSDVTLTFTPLQYGEALKLNVPKSDKNLFAKNVTLKAGDYSLEIKNATETRNISPVCVGEVLLWTGHSFADGYGCLPENNKSAYYSENYWERKDENAFKKPDSPLNFRNNSTVDKRRGLAGRIASRLADKLQVPVMMYLCSWGGTNIVQWANSADGKDLERAKNYPGYRPDFEKKGYPYRILGETLKNFVPNSGARGLLIIHGDNDKGNSYNEQLDCYARLLQKIRQDVGYPTLSISIAKSCNDLGQVNVLEAIQRTVSSDPHNYLGCEVTDNTINNKLRYDGLHLNEQGEDKVAELWANNLVESRFFEKTPLSSNTKLVDETTGNAVTRPTQILATAQSDTLDSPTKSSFITMAAVILVLVLVSFFVKFRTAFVFLLTAMFGVFTYFIQRAFNNLEK